MIEKWNPAKPILSYTDTETVKLDFDNSNYETVKNCSTKIMKMFKLERFIILKSSDNHCHTLFDGTVTWLENLKIMAWTVLLTHNLSQLKYLQMQCIKESSTLRVSSKKGKPMPRVVFHYGKQNNEIRVPRVSYTHQGHCQKTSEPK